MSYYNPITTIASVGTQSTPIPVTIASATEPTTRENGGTLRQGDNWYNIDSSKDYIWITNADGSGGSWRLVGTGAGGGDGTVFTGGYVPRSILVGGTELNPNLTLSDNGGIIAEQTIEIRTPTDSGVSFVVKDRDESTGLRILGDGTLQTGMKTGDQATAPDVGIQLNPQGTIEMGGSTLKVENNTLFINNIAIIEATSLDTAAVNLTNPTTVTGSKMLTRFNISALGQLPDISGLSTQEDFNQWGYAASEYLELNKVDEAPKDGLTYGRSDGAWIQVAGITVKGTVDSFTDLASVPNPTNGDLYVVEENGHGYVYENGDWEDIGAIQGPPGPQGNPGTAATVTVGTTTTGVAGSSAAVTNSGSTSAAILDFTIPQGAKGDTGAEGTPGAKGDPGTPGAAATVQAGQTITGDAGTDADVTNVGTTAAAVFDFTIPKGLRGERGPTGEQGNPGKNGTDGISPTVQAGTTTTVTPDKSAEVTNIGSTSAAVFDFKIPQGVAGTDGAPGAAGDPGTPGAAATVNAGSTSTLVAGSNATVTNTGDTTDAVFDFGIPQGVKGDTGTAGNDGAAATVNVGTTTTGVAGSNAAVTNSGTSAAAVFNFTVPQGIQGIQGIQGEAGTSINLSGTVAEVADLPTYAPAGTLYIVEFDGDGYVSDGASPTSDWTDVGKIQGPVGPQGPAGPVAGSNTQIVFNDNGSASGAADLTFSNNTLTTDKITTTGDITVGSGGFYYGDGSKLLNISIPNSFTFKGDVDVVAGDAPTNDGAALDANDAGFFYLNTVAGSANSNFTGITGNTFAKDQTLFWDGSAFFAGAQQSLNTTLLLTGGDMNDSGGGANGLITFADAQTFPATGIQGASTGQAGIVQLTNSLISTAEDLAPTAKSIKGVNDNLTTLTTTVSTNTTNISNNDADILSNTNNITTLTDNLAATDVQVADNTAAIASNATAISNVKTTADGALSKSLGGTMQGNITMGGTTVVKFSDTQTFPGTITDLPTAGIGQAGIVQLTNDKESTSQTLAPTAKSLSDVYDTASSANTLAGNALSTTETTEQTMAGPIAFSGDQTFPEQDITEADLPKGSINQLGIVELSDKVDGDSIELAATENAVASAYDRGTAGISAAATAQSAAEAAATAAADAATDADTASAAAATAATAAETADTKAGNAQSTANAALPKTGGKMLDNEGGANGIITFADGQTFPGAEGDVQSVNNVEPATDGNITLTAANVDAVSLEDGGTFGGSISGPTTEEGADENEYTTKNYVLSKISAAGGGTVTDITAGSGLTTSKAESTISVSGTLSVLAADDTILVDATGIKVDQNKLNFPVVSVNGENGEVSLTADNVGALPIDGSTAMTGTLKVGTTDKFSVTTGGTLKANSGEFAAAVLVNTGANESSIIPLFRGFSANKSRFIVESDGTLRIGDDLDMNTASGGDAITMKTDGSLALTGKATSALTIESDDANVLTTKAYVLSKIGAASSDGTVTQVNSGNGLTGGPIDTTGTLSVQALNNTISVADGGISVVTANLTAAAVGTVGVTDLSSATSSTDEDKAATPKAVKDVKDVADAAATTAGEALPKDGSSAMSGNLSGTTGSFTGKITTAATVEGDGATTLTTKGYVLSKVAEVVTFKGNIDATTTTAPSASAGDFYLNTTAGNVDSSYTGLNSGPISADQFIFFTSGNVWELGGVQATDGFVTLTTDQTISGVKTFESDVTIPVAPLTNTSASSKKYVDDKVNDVSATSLNALSTTDTNAQTMAGAITFASSQSVGSSDTAGILKISDSTDTTSDSIAASLTAVKSAKDTADTATTVAAGAKTTAEAALPLTGGTMSTTGGTGIITFVGAQVFPRVLSTTLTDVQSMAGLIDFADDQAFPGTVTSVTAGTGSPNTGAVTITAADLDAVQLTKPSQAITGNLSVSGDFSVGSNFSIDSTDGFVVGTAVILQQGLAIDHAVINSTAPSLVLSAGVTEAGAPNIRTVIMQDGSVRLGEQLDLSAPALDKVLISPTGSIDAKGEITSALTTNASDDNVCATKGFVLDKVGAAGGGSVVSVGAGNGLQTSLADNADISTAGSLSIKLQTNSGLIVTSDGLKFDSSTLPDAPVQTVNNISPINGNVTLTANNVSALPIDGTTGMTGLMTFFTDQKFPGTVTKINTTIVPDANGDVTLDASDVDAVSKTAGGTFDAAVTVKGNITAGTGGVISGDGSGLTNLNVPASLSFKGNTNVTETAPSAVTGDLYLNTVSGVAAASWTGIATKTVLDNQFVIYTAGGTWVEGAILDASTFVTKSTTQVITGAKTFTKDTSFSQDITVAENVTAKEYYGSGKNLTDLPEAPVQKVNNKTGDVTLGASDVGALSITGGAMSTTGGTGLIAFVADQTFPGTVETINSSISPDVNGNLTLTAANVDAVSADSGGEFKGEVKGVATSESSASSSFVTKGYVDTSIESSSDGDVVSVAAGAGLIGTTIDKANPSGSFAVLADGDTISVSETGIKVATDNLPYPVISVNNEIGEVVLTAKDVGAIAAANGSFTGTLSGTTLELTGNAITAGYFRANKAATGDTAFEVRTDDVITSKILAGGGLAIGGTIDESATQSSANIFLKDDGSAKFVGDVTANKFIGSGSGLTDIVASAVSTTAPTGTHTEGDLWYSSDDGILYVWYIDETQDGDEGQWVDVRPAGYVQSVISVNDRTGVVVLTADDIGAISTTGGDATGEITAGSFSSATYKVPGFTANSVPYVTTAGVITPMAGVTYNSATDTLSVSNLDAPSTGGNITIAASFDVNGAADFGDTLSVKKATTLDGSLDVTGVTTVTGLNVNGNLTHTGDHTVTGNINTTGNVTANKFYGDGSNLTNLPIPAATDFKGTINATTGTAPSAVDGDVYSNTTAGAAAATYTGINGQALSANQLIFYANNQWELGGIEDTSNLVSVASAQTITGAKTFSANTSFSDTGTFIKSNGRAIEVKTGGTLNGYWTGSGDITAKSFKQSGSTTTNSFTGAITTSNSLTVGTTTQHNGTVTVGSNKLKLTTSGTIQGVSGTFDSVLMDKLQLTNLTGLSQLPGTPTAGTIAMFAGVLYYYGASNAWYRFNVTTANPPA